MHPVTLTKTDNSFQITRDCNIYTKEIMSLFCYMER